VIPGTFRRRWHGRMDSLAPMSAVAALAVLMAVMATPTNAATVPPAFVPCPVVRVAPYPPAPPKPSPLPTHPVAASVIGGAGLDTTGLAVPPGSPALPKDISARYWLVADLDTGAVLGACAPHAYFAPASVQKLLLAATVMPNLNPAAVTTITAGDMNIEPGSSAVGLVQGGRYTVETLWLGLLLNSGNEAANALARLGGGQRGVAGTIADMNAMARHLGALDTHAATPSGLDGPGQVTSTYDLALIARADFARPDFCRYTGTRTAQIPAQPPHKGFQIQNDNQLLFNYPGAIGGKTGFTDIARHSYVGAAQRGGRRLVVTMLAGEHQPVRMWMQGASLLDWGFRVAPGASVGRLVSPGELERATPSPSASPGLGTIAAVPAGQSASGKLIWLAAAGLVVIAGLVTLGAVSRRRRIR
jgi:D-alanyl-D-alanine carboxypeptidase (penicillin-binding protein 5/6)